MFLLHHDHVVITHAGLYYTNRCVVACDETKYIRRTVFIFAGDVNTKDK